MKSTRDPESACGATARPRARAYGLTFGPLATGRHNSITDVSGVRVGSVTLCAGTGREAVRTGVTVVVPHPGNLLAEKTTSAAHVINGHGKPTGLSQIAELGVIETPIAITSTLSVGDAFRGLVLDALRRDSGTRSVNPVVLECNDGSLNNSSSLPITAEHILCAIDEARSGPVEEGNAGAGMGMCSFGWKSGIGTASRLVAYEGGEGNLGVLVVSNFGYPEDLIIQGCHVGRHLPRPGIPARAVSGGSLAAVIATDLPLDARQLGRLARRAQTGVARVGGYVGHSSGEFVIAFSIRHGSTTQPARDDDGLDAPFHAAIDATEEAILNSIFCATTVTGVNGMTVRELPIDAVMMLLRGREGSHE